MYQNFGEDKATRDENASDYLALAYSVYSDAHEQIERQQRLAAKREMQAKAAKAEELAAKLREDAAALGGDSLQVDY